MLTNVVQTDMGLECSENALLDGGEKLTVSVCYNDAKQFNYKKRN